MVTGHRAFFEEGSQDIARFFSLLLKKEWVEPMKVG
jgi:hypothetical protein